MFVDFFGAVVFLAIFREEAGVAAEEVGIGWVDGDGLFVDFLGVIILLANGIEEGGV